MSVLVLPLVTRGKITKGTAEGEWRDVLGIEAVRAIGPLERQDPPKVEEPKALVNAPTPSYQ